MWGDTRDQDPTTLNRMRSIVVWRTWVLSSGALGGFNEEVRELSCERIGGFTGGVYCWPSRIVAFQSQSARSDTQNWSLTGNL